EFEKPPVPCIAAGALSVASSLVAFPDQLLAHVMLCVCVLLCTTEYADTEHRITGSPRLLGRELHADVFGDAFFSQRIVNALRICTRFLSNNTSAFSHSTPDRRSPRLVRQLTHILQNLIESFNGHVSPLCLSGTAHVLRQSYKSCRRPGSSFSPSETAF